MTNTTPPYKQVLGMGILAGMRSAIVPVLAAEVVNDTQNNCEDAPRVIIPTQMISNTLKVIALAEFLADKLPFAPDRTRPVSVVVRCISGAVMGAGIFNAAGKKASTGAFLGAAAAGASTFGSFFLRKTLAKTGLGYFVSGIIEDAFVVSAAIKLARTV